MERRSVTTSKLDPLDHTARQRFFPAKTEFAPLTYRVTASLADSSPVVINELMASNTKGFTDQQVALNPDLIGGDNDDWIELHNVSDYAVNLSGMYLTDNQNNPRKWQFPNDTQIAPGGYLIVWADEDGNAEPGLHANFKLSRNGETVMLIDTDQGGNQVLDVIKFEDTGKKMWHLVECPTALESLSR